MDPPAIDTSAFYAAHAAVTAARRQRSGRPMVDAAHGFPRSGDERFAWLQVAALITRQHLLRRERGVRDPCKAGAGIPEASIPFASPP